MARGQQKIQAQQKNAQKLQAQKKSNKTSSEKEAEKMAGISNICVNCKSLMTSTKQYKQHWENKHSKLPMPEELKSA